jgi:subtilisin-like proprotein convertase family protein
VISAWFWEHDVFDGTGFFLRNLVGLGAVSIERSGTRQGEDIPGDESAGSRGIPFEQAYDEDGEPILEFCFMGPLPLCPGFPDLRPDPEDCPAVITAACDNCPTPILDLASVFTQADVDLLAQCAIADVDLTLDISHTWDADMNVSLTSPEGTDSQMFSGICGASDNVQAILDDDAATPIGSVCPPAGFARYTTQSGTGLDLFDGEDPAGEWELEIADTVGADAGTLNDWVLTIELE